jgi:hypothetical protein
MPPFTHGPVAVKYEQAMTLAMRDVVCPLFGFWTLRGMRLTCP